MRSLGALVVVVAWSSRASAKPLDLGALVEAGEAPAHGDTATSYSVGIEAALVPFTASDGCGCSICDVICKPNTGPYYFGLGAYATRADGAVNQTRRDLYGLHPSAGLAAPAPRWLIPFITVGLDALYVDTRLASGVRARGVTLGADARAGVLGYLGEHVMYSLSASYLGAVTPGVGDNVGGLVVSIAVGWRFIQKQ